MESYASDDVGALLAIAARLDAAVCRYALAAATTARDAGIDFPRELLARLPEPLQSRVLTLDTSNDCRKYGAAPRQKAHPRIRKTARRALR